MKVPKVCPRCEGWIPNNEQPGAYPGALSRRDNGTEICSACGTAEAVEDYYTDIYGQEARLVPLTEERADKLLKMILEDN